MPSDKFVNRHNGPRESELPGMLEIIGVTSLDQLIEKTVPKSIMLEKPLRLPQPMSEFEYLNHIRAAGKKNKMFRYLSVRGIMEWLRCRLS
jgi:glycine dehydrogenase